MECSTCFEAYTTREKIPRNLECGHTFCEACLLRLHTESRILCPTCRQVSLIENPRDLPKNFIAASLAAKYQEDKKRKSLCSTHSFEVNRFFCNTCDISICVECLISHSSHRFVKLEDSTKFLHKQAQSLKDRLRHCLFVNSCLQESLQTSKREVSLKLDEGRDYIDSTVSSLVSELENNQDRLKASLKQAASLELELINKRQTKLQELTESLESIKFRTSAIPSSVATDSDLEGGSLSETLFTLKEQVQNVGATLSTLKPILHEVPSLKKDANITPTIQSLGSIVPGSSCNKGRPFLSFFGDKFKVMSFDIERSIWEIRTLQNSIELNYYAAAASLHDGSALITGGGSSSSVFLYKDGELHSKPAMARIRKEHAALCINRHVYVMGGYDSVYNQFLAECERFNLQTSVWERAAPMNKSRCAFSATVVNSRFIYVFGGYDGHNRLASIEKYSYDNDCWELIAHKLRFPLSNCACFSPEKNTVVVLGGGFSSGFSLAVEMYNIETGEWSSLPMMTEGRDLRNKICFFEGEVYCVGGYNFKAEKLHMNTKTWAQLPDYLVIDNLDSWASALTYRSGN